MDMYDILFYDFFSDKVQGLAYASGSKQLLSGSDDSILGIWNMDVKRIEVKWHVFIHVIIEAAYKYAICYLGNDTKSFHVSFKVYVICG